MLGGENTVIKQSQSSLPLQVGIYFNWHFMAFFFLLNLALFTYKSVNYYYPASTEHTSAICKTQPCFEAI